MNYAKWPRENIIDRCESLETQLQIQMMRANDLAKELKEHKLIIKNHINSLKGDKHGR